MSLKDKLLEQAPRSTSGTYSRGKCAVREWLVTQDEKTISEFAEILLEDISTLALYRFLKTSISTTNYGVTSFRSHRNHWCSCL
jgi:hypothetical protein